MIHQFPGGDSGGATPDSIPNSEVKTSRADGTAWATVWESRSLPGAYFIRKALTIVRAFRYFEGLFLGE